MGSLDFGTQINTFCYENEASSASFNTILNDILSDGVYKGGIITKVSDEACSVGATVAIVTDPAKNISIRCQTTVPATIAVSSANCYIVMRLDWLDQINNYVDILGVPVESILDKDVVLAKAVYSGSTLTTFDYSYKTKNIFEILVDDIATCTADFSASIAALTTAVATKYNSNDMTQVGGTPAYGNKGIKTDDYGFISDTFISFGENTQENGAPAAGTSKKIAHEDHVHDIFTTITNKGNVSDNYVIPIGEKEIVTVTATTVFTLGSGFRNNKENWFDITIINLGELLTYFPDEWKWINNTSVPIGTAKYNLVGWSYDNTTWNVGYIILGI